MSLRQQTNMLCVTCFLHGCHPLETLKYKEEEIICRYCFGGGPCSTIPAAFSLLWQNFCDYSSLLFIWSAKYKNGGMRTRLTQTSLDLWQAVFWVATSSTATVFSSFTMKALRMGSSSHLASVRVVRNLTMFHSLLSNIRPFEKIHVFCVLASEVLLSVNILRKFVHLKCLRQWQRMVLVTQSLGSSTMLAALGRGSSTIHTFSVSSGVLKSGRS